MKDNKVIYRIINGKGENRRLDRRYVFLGFFIFAMVATFSFFYTRSMDNANAVDLSGFKAGNIITDAVMRNYTSMSEAEIQSFLNKKNTCNKPVSSVSGMKKASGKSFGVSYQYTYSYGGSTYYYHVEDGKFVCLNNEKFDGETAAHIIYQAAQDYKINPQVLIVLLQKEQGLITDQWPNINHQYRSATGYGCPDNAACDSKYYGFKNQVTKAAALFNTVLAGGWTNYPIGYNIIRWSPKASCGSSKVYIENLATSALYRYTPYQPNAKALAAGYGNGDSCSAYGNRNFYAYFTDWFGSTQKVGDYATTEAFNSLTDAQKQDKIYITWAQNAKNAGDFTGSVKTHKKNNKIRILQTKNGIIFGNEEKGYYYTKVNILDKWIDNIDELGYPNGIPEKSEATKNEWQSFEKGHITGNDKKGWYISKGEIRKAWGKRSYVSGVLGFPASDIFKNDDYEYQKYEGGVLFGNSKDGYYVMKEKAFEKWQEIRKEYGYPAGDIQVSEKTKTEWYAFAKKDGLLVGNDEKGWYISYGKSREVWGKYGYASGLLGFATSDVQKNDKIGIMWQSYENGVITGNDEKGWYISYGKSRETWSETGYASGTLGFPVSDIECSLKTKACWQSYENGLITGNDEKGWYESRGVIREKWMAANHVLGKYGWTTSNIDSNGCQKFENGTICEK